MSGFREFEDADRRLSILQILAAADGYRAGAPLIQRALGGLHGHEVGMERLAADLEWLRSLGMVDTEQPQAIVFATLTQRGLDVSEGRARVPGIARPGP